MSEQEKSTFYFLPSIARSSAPTITPTTTPRISVDSQDVKKDAENPRDGAPTPKGRRRRSPTLKIKTRKSPRTRPFLKAHKQKKRRIRCDIYKPLRQKFSPQEVYSIDGKGKDLRKDFIMQIQGEIGYWQVLIVLIMLVFNIPSVFQVSSPEVTANNHSSWCARPTYFSNMSVDQWCNLSGIYKKNMRGEYIYDRCWKKDLPYHRPLQELLQIETDKKTKCDTWDYDESQVSVISQFNLACTSMPVNNMAETMFSVGGALGGITNGMLSDRYGRRRVLMISQGFIVLTGFAIANASSYSTYLLCRVILGYLCSAVTLCSWVICIEILGGKWRSIFTTVNMYSFSLGYISLFMFSKLFKVWIYLQYSITLISIFLLSIWWLVPESPRWLLTVQNIQKLMTMLEMGSSFNRQPLAPGIPALLRKTRPMMNRELKKATFPMLFKTKAIRRLSLTGPFPAFFCCLTYYGLVLNNDLYTTTGFFYSALSELLACTFAIMLSAKHDDVETVTVSIGLSGVCCLIASGLTDSNNKGYALDIVCLFARFFGGMMNSCLTTILACTYPTVIRTMGLGWCYCFECIALCVAANIVELGRVSPPLPLIILGLSALFGSFSLFFIPQRVNVQLLDLIEEVELVFQGNTHDLPWKPKNISQHETSIDKSITDEEPESSDLTSPPKTKPKIGFDIPKEVEKKDPPEKRGWGVLSVPPIGSKRWSTLQSVDEVPKSKWTTKETINPGQASFTSSPVDPNKESPLKSWEQKSSHKSHYEEVRHSAKHEFTNEYDDDIPYHCSIL